MPYTTFPKILWLLSKPIKHSCPLTLNTNRMHIHPRPAMSNRNALLGQKICHYLYEGSTLNDLFSFQQTKVYFKLLKAFEY